jgi:dienelactone hydrolase
MGSPVRSQRRLAVALSATLLVGLLLKTVSLADAPRVLPTGKLPSDKRLGKAKNLNGYFPFTPSESPQQWASRAEQVRRQVLIGNGLWPMPTKTPVNAVVHGKIDRQDYTVERVYLESFPGHFVTGSLYRPKGKSGRLPCVLCPHGHWPDGRFFDHGPEKIKQEIAAGAEKFESGRYPLQARCVQLARMGCIVFHYDMLGYADSVQLEHRPGSRESMNAPENWGFFSPQAELRLQSMMGLQTYNSIRALDWLCELPDVDPAHIGVTGASGGGTQTFILCAVDPRPTVQFPAVMVSTAMQGGCTCENCNYLRVESGNIELAALFAPKPLAMSAANDWTKEIATKGLPELKQHYAMMGAPQNVMAQYFDFPHNYNYVSRALMYGWFNRHLKLGQAEPVVERDFDPLSRDELTVWDESHPKPPSGDDYERSLLAVMNADSHRQLAALTPTNAEKLEEFRDIVGGAFDTMIGRRLPPAGAVKHEHTAMHDRGDYVEFLGLLRNVSAGEELPSVVLHPKKWNKQVVVWVTDEGKQDLYDTSGALRPAITALLSQGTSVIAADLLHQGEFLADGKPLEQTTLVRSGRDAWAAYAGYTFGYNRALLAQRVHDILAMISYAKHHPLKPERIHLAGFGKAGVLAAAAAVQAMEAIDRLAIDTGGFRFENLTEIDDPHFLPGAVKYGDLPALLALAAPHRLWLAGERGQTPEIVAAAYRAADAPTDGIIHYDGSTDEKQESAAAWLTK